MRICVYRNIPHFFWFLTGVGCWDVIGWENGILDDLNVDGNRFGFGLAWWILLSTGAIDNWWMISGGPLKRG